MKGFVVFLRVLLHIGAFNAWFSYVSVIDSPEALIDKLMYRRIVTFSSAALSIIYSLLLFLSQDFSYKSKFRFIVSFLVLIPFQTYLNQVFEWTNLVVPFHAAKVKFHLVLILFALFLVVLKVRAIFTSEARKFSLLNPHSYPTIFAFMFYLFVSWSFWWVYWGLRHHSLEAAAVLIGAFVCLVGYQWLRGAFSHKRTMLIDFSDMFTLGPKTKQD